MNISFQITNDLSELTTLQAQLQPLQKTWSLPKKTVIEINLILEELVTNIIKHGDSGNKHIIEINLSKKKQQLTMIVMDDGPPFDPTLCELPDITLPLEKRQCGGLGIHFVCKLSDCRNYSRSKNKNILTLKKNLPKEHK
jgi:serine/threonine-protein kinase RsbW